MGTSTAAVWEKTNRGGSFRMGTARAFFSAPSIASMASRRSSDMVERPLVAIAWKPCWYCAARGGADGNVAFFDRDVGEVDGARRPATVVLAVISMTPKIGSLAPAGTTETAACASMS